MENKLVCALFKKSRINKNFKRCVATFRGMRFPEKLTESSIYQITSVKNIKILLLIFLNADAVITQFLKLMFKMECIQ